jgi:hypothetical protein
MEMDISYTNEFLIYALFLPAWEQLPSSGHGILQIYIS